MTKFYQLNLYNEPFCLLRVKDKTHYPADYPIALIEKHMDSFVNDFIEKNKYITDEYDLIECICDDLKERNYDAYRIFVDEIDLDIK